MSAMPNRPDPRHPRLGAARPCGRRSARRVCYVARTNRELAVADLEQVSVRLEATEAEPYVRSTGETLH